MSQKKVYLYSPDGKEEGWFMELEAPAGWLPSPPKELETSEVEPPEHTGGLTDVNDSGDDQELADLQRQLDDLEAKEAEDGGSYQDPEAAA